MNYEYLGNHNWEAMNGYIIVGFQVWATIWAGKPSRSGWDTPLRRKLVESFANIQDADSYEMELRNRKIKNTSYYVLPLQVKSPSKEKK